jgi:hypothetical protein
MRIIDSNNLDEKVVEFISNFKPYRDKFIKVISLFCDYDLIEQYKEHIFTFFEKFLGLHDPPISMTSYNKCGLITFDSLAWSYFFISSQF